MNRRRSAALAAGTVLALSGLTLTGCGSVNRALDCAKTAASIAGDIQDLQSNATNIGQISDRSRRRATVAALDKVRADLKNLGRRSHDKDVTSAVDELDTAVRNAQSSAADGRDPDLKPVGKAASHLTGVCTPG